MCHQEISLLPLQTSDRKYRRLGDGLFVGISGHPTGEWAGSGSEGAAAWCEGANCAGCLYPAPASSVRAAVAKGQQVCATAKFGICGHQSEDLLTLEFIDIACADHADHRRVNRHLCFQTVNFKSGKIQSRKLVPAPQNAYRVVVNFLSDNSLHLNYH